MEETSRRSFLGRHQSCYQERIAVLSDSIERRHSLRHSPSLLYSESCLIEDWRSLIRKSIHVTSPSAKDLIETRMEKRIGFGSCSTTRRPSCATIKKFPLLLLIRLMRKTALEYVLLMKAIRSTLKMKNFVKEWKNPLLIMTRVMNQ